MSSLIISQTSFVAFHFDHLLLELKVEIFKLLTTRELVTCQSICKEWREATLRKDNPLRKRITLLWAKTLFPPLPGSIGIIAMRAIFLAEWSRDQGSAQLFLEESKKKAKVPEENQTAPPSKYLRLRSLLEMAKIEHEAIPGNAQATVESALDLILTLENLDDRGRALEEALPFLSRFNLDRAITLARSIVDNYVRIHTLIGIINSCPEIDPRLAKTLISEVLVAIEAIDQPEERFRAFVAALKVQLRFDQQGAVRTIQRAVEAFQAIFERDEVLDEMLNLVAIHATIDLDAAQVTARAISQYMRVSTRRLKKETQAIFSACLHSVADEAALRNPERAKTIAKANSDRVLCCQSLLKVAAIEAQYDPEAASLTFQEVGERALSIPDILEKIEALLSLAESLRSFDLEKAKVTLDEALSFAQRSLQSGVQKSRIFFNILRLQLMMKYGDGQVTLQSIIDPHCRTLAFLELSQFYRHSDPKQARAFIEEAMACAQSINDLERRILVYLKIVKVQASLDLKGAKMLMEWALFLLQKVDSSLDHGDLYFDIATPLKEILDQA